MRDRDEATFSSDEEKILWIETVMDDFRAGVASAEDVECLRSMLLHDAAARRIYIESNQLNCLLESVSMGAEPVEFVAEPGGRSLKRIALWCGGIAAALALAFGLWLLAGQTSSREQHEAQWLAVLSASHGAVWDRGAEGGGERFGAGTFALSSGIAELEFRNGARIVIEGPCDMEIIDGDSIRLGSGKLWAHCPPSAQGFEVLAPGGNRIVDHGTEFAVGVGPAGAVDVHVFDGEVSVFPKAHAEQALVAGGAIQLVPGQTPVALKADFERFTDAPELRGERWKLHHQEMLERDDLLLYYDFTSSESLGKTLPNRSGEWADAEVLGAVPVAGRAPGKSALLFEKRSDAVSFNLDSKPLGEGFTIAMWIKPYTLSRTDIVLLNSNGFDPGDIHFQVTEAGNVQAGIHGIGAFGSEPGLVTTGTWQLVAVTWDLEAREAHLFHNGKLLSKRVRRSSTPNPDTVAKFGRCQIGSWGEPKFPAPRNFVGRIDEVMVFSSRLDAAAMRQLYESSRP